MKITWVTRSFLDYRIPVYEAINTLCNNNLTVIYFKDVVPERCQNKLKLILGERAIGLSGELRIGGKKNQPLSSIKRNGIRIPIQPGLIRKIKNTNPDVILSDGFFQWTAYNTETFEFFGCGGGRYEANEGDYYESIVYFSRDNTRSGQTLSFKYEQIENDWHHTGFSSKGLPLHEIWTLRQTE